MVKIASLFLTIGSLCTFPLRLTPNKNFIKKTFAEKDLNLTFAAPDGV